MTATSEIRSATGEVQTRIPGVTFGGTFPKLAALADKVSIVRSYVPGNGNHELGRVYRLGYVHLNPLANAVTRSSDRAYVVSAAAGIRLAGGGSVRRTGSRLEGDGQQITRGSEDRCTFANGPREDVV